MYSRESVLSIVRDRLQCASHGNSAHAHRDGADSSRWAPTLACVFDVMKLPRWLVACLLTISVASIPLVGVGWWITWPRRTIATLATSLGDVQMDVANGLVSPDGKWSLEQDGIIGFGCPRVIAGTVRFSPPTWEWIFDEGNLEWEPPSFADLFFGTRRFKAQEGYLEFVVTRGRIAVIAEHNDRWGHFMRKYVAEFLELTP